MTPIEIFLEALDAMQRLAALYPDRRAIISAIEQLNYLIELQKDANPDQSKLKDINIGLIAVREIDHLDVGAAEKLHAAAYTVRQLDRP